MKKGPRITPGTFHCKSKKHINYETKYFIKNKHYLNHPPHFE